MLINPTITVTTDYSNYKLRKFEEL